ncbi:MAG: hypothetical protein AAF456_22865 [Planctomycetota bacterium]
MDKKAKKRLEVLRKKMTKYQAILAAAKQQTDEPDEIQKAEQEIEAIRAEIDKIKSAG